LVAFDCDDKIIAAVDDLLNCFFGCATHPS
jgi:hypothetical protein